MLKLDDFLKLSDVEKGERYEEMSDHDKFLWRVQYEPLVGRDVGEFEISEEEKKEADIIMDDFIEKFMKQKNKG